MTSEFDLNSVEQGAQSVQYSGFLSLGIYEKHTFMRIRLHASYHHRVSRAVLTRQELQLSHYGLPPLELRIAPTSSSSRRNPPLYHRRAAKRYGPFSPHVPRCCSILDRLIANAYAKRRTPVPDEHVRSPIFTALRLSYHNPSRVALTDHVGCPTRLFTWNTQDLCLVFRWWHVTGPISLVLSLLGVVALSMGYEYVREVSRRYEARVDAAVTQGLSKFNVLNPLWVAVCAPKIYCEWWIAVMSGKVDIALLSRA